LEGLSGGQEVQLHGELGPVGGIECDEKDGGGENERQIEEQGSTKKATVAVV